MDTAKLDFLTEDEVVAVYRRGKKYWYRQRCARQIPFSKLGRVILYRRSDVEKFVADRSFGPHRQPASSPAGSI